MPALGIVPLPPPATLSRGCLPLRARSLRAVSGGNGSIAFQALLRRRSLLLRPSRRLLPTARRLLPAAILSAVVLSTVLLPAGRRGPSRRSLRR